MKFKAMNIEDYFDELPKTREELIAAQKEIQLEEEIPQKIRGQIIAEICRRISSLKKSSPQGGFFYSFMSENEAISCISRLSVGQFIVRAEPEAMISYFPLTAEEYDCMVDKDWQEFV